MSSYSGVYLLDTWVVIGKKLGENPNPIIVYVVAHSAVPVYGAIQNN